MAGRGRPELPGDLRKSKPIGIRLTPAMHAKLKSASAQANRLMSQEIEARLRLSFQEEERAWQRFGGPTTYWLFQQAAHWISFDERRTGHKWWEDPELFVRSRAIVLAMIDALKPRGRISSAFRAEAERRGQSIGKVAMANLELVLEDPRVGNAFGGPHAFAAAGPVASKLPASAMAEIAAHVARTATLPSLRDAAKRAATRRKGDR